MAYKHVLDVSNSQTYITTDRNSSVDIPPANSRDYTAKIGKVTLFFVYVLVFAVFLIANSYAGL